MQAIHITLHGKNNVTYSGTLILQEDNWTSVEQKDKIATPATGASTGEEEDYDQVGASYYVIAVVLVYGMSIVMLIASHIKRRHEKVLEDKQIDKYLQDFQIVKERHDRDTYKNLKKTIMAKINWDRHHKDTYKNLQQTIIPVLAIGIPGTGHRDIGHSASTSLESLGSQRPRLKQLSADSREEEENTEAENAARQLFDRPRRFSETSDVLRRQIIGLSNEEEPEVPNALYLHPGSHRPSETSLMSVHSSSRRQIFTVEESCEDDELDEDAQKARDKYEAEQAARQLFDRPRRASVCVENSSMRNARMLRRSSRVQSIDEISLDHQNLHRDLHARRESYREARENPYRLGGSFRESYERKSFDIPPIEEVGKGKCERRASSPHRRKSMITPPVMTSRSLTTSPVSWQGQIPNQLTSDASASKAGSQEKAGSGEPSAKKDEGADGDKAEPEQAPKCEYCRVGSSPHCGDVVWLDNNTSPDSGVATPTRDYLSPPSTIAPAITITRVNASNRPGHNSAVSNMGRHSHGAPSRATSQPGVHRKPSSLTYAKPPSPFFQRSRSAPNGPNGANSASTSKGRAQSNCPHQLSAPAEGSSPTRTSPSSSANQPGPLSTFQRQAALADSAVHPSDEANEHCALNMESQQNGDSSDTDSEDKVLQITVL